MPLKKTVIGAAVKEKICEMERTIKLRLNTKELIYKIENKYNIKFFKYYLYLQLND